MIKKVLRSLLVIVVLFLAYAATRPAAYHVERSATLPAAPSALFVQVNDSHNFTA